jgi:RNA polymerase sigma-70 factor (sigma-E family)
MVRRGSDEFTSFVVASQPRLRRTAYLMCGDWQLASDYVQEALLRVYRHWPKLHRDGRGYAYARKALVSVVIDDKRRRSSGEVPVAEVAEGLATTDSASASADRDLLSRCLARVPSRQRACLVLRYFDDLSVSDTAAVLGCSEGTVKSQTARGLVTLQAVYARETDEQLLVTGKE